MQLPAILFFTITVDGSFLPNAWSVSAEAPVESLARRFELVAV